MGRRHYGCEKPTCKIVRAYIRYERTKWKAVGYYGTGCEIFWPDSQRGKANGE